jgi:Tol biopolymer transport system component
VLPLSQDLRASGEPRQLTFDHRRVLGCAWTPDGREIIFSSNRSGDYALWRIAASGSGQPVRLASAGEDGFFPSVSRPRATGGSRLAYARAVADRDIWRLDVQSGAHTRFISSTRDDMAPQYSPDGGKIAFTSVRTGAYEIWVCQSDGSNAQPLTSFRGPSTDRPSWSPDGRRIAFHTRPEGTADIYVVDADGGSLRRLTTEPGDDVAPSWSHDGRWIYFGSNRTGKDQIWRLPAEGGPAVQVTRNGGIYAQESPDGKLLFYTKARGATPLWKAPSRRASGAARRARWPKLSAT